MKTHIEVTDSRWNRKALLPITNLVVSVGITDKLTYIWYTTDGVEVEPMAIAESYEEVKALKSKQIIQYRKS